MMASGVRVPIGTTLGFRPVEATAGGVLCAHATATQLLMKT